MTFLHGAILFGLLALVIPPIVHLLNRRRFDVVDWAAMQFLQISKKTRQRMMFEELLLMLLRIVMIAALVLAIASPVLRLSCVARLPAGERLARLAGQTQRDIVLVFDGSYSMDCQWQGRTAHDAARAWASDFLGELGPSDRVAIVQAKQQPIPVLGLLTADTGDIRARLEQMPRPHGGVNWQKALHESERILEEGQRSEREIIILTDGQRQGWADQRAIRDWELLALGSTKTKAAPRIFVVNVAPDRPDDVPNWAVGPIRANRALATVGREVTFKFNLQALLSPPRPGERKSETPLPPAKVEFKVDEEAAAEKDVPRAREPTLAMDFKRSFSSTGSHLVSVIISPDALPGDNRRDFAIDVVPAIPVLIVDGDKVSLAATRTSDYFRVAVAPANHPQPSFVVRTITISELNATALTTPVSRAPNTLPRVVVLHDVPSLTEAQHKLIEEFLKSGGGVLALLGPRTEAASFNKLGMREPAGPGASVGAAEGWLPARLLAPTGDEKDPKKAAFPIADGLDRTFLEIFKEPDPESFLKSSFGRWWKLDTAAAGAGNTVPRLAPGAPLFVEKSVGKGRGPAWPPCRLTTPGATICCAHTTLFASATNACSIWRGRAPPRSIWKRGRRSSTGRPTANRPAA